MSASTKNAPSTMQFNWKVQKLVASYKRQMNLQQFVGYEIELIFENGDVYVIWLLECCFIDVMLLPIIWSLLYWYDVVVDYMIVASMIWCWCRLYMHDCMLDDALQKFVSFWLQIKTIEFDHLISPLQRFSNFLLQNAKDSKHGIPLTIQI